MRCSGALRTVRATHASLAPGATSLILVRARWTAGAAGRTQTAGVRACGACNLD